MVDLVAHGLAETVGSHEDADHPVVLTRPSNLGGCIQWSLVGDNHQAVEPIIYGKPALYRPVVHRLRQCVGPISVVHTGDEHSAIVRQNSARYFTGSKYLFHGALRVRSRWCRRFRGAFLVVTAGPSIRHRWQDGHRTGATRQRSRATYVFAP